LVRLRPALPEAGPVVGDKDAVAGVSGVVTDLDGLVEAEAEDEFGERRDVLCAVVGDSCDSIAVEEHLWCGRGAVVAIEGAGVEDDAVGDAANLYDVIAAAAFELEGGGALEIDEEPGEATARYDACDDATGDAGVRADLGLNGTGEVGKLLEMRNHGWGMWDGSAIWDSEQG
jgi:hypothetical protein